MPCWTGHAHAVYIKPDAAIWPSGAQLGTKDYFKFSRALLVAELSRLFKKFVPILYSSYVHLTMMATGKICMKLKHMFEHCTVDDLM